MLFWTLVAAMLLIALAILVVPSLRITRDDDVSRKDVNVELYRNEVARLERDLADGQIDQHTFDSSKQELDLNLLADTENDEAEARNQSGRLPAIITVVAVPIMAVGLYLGLGQSDIATGKLVTDRPAELQAIEQMMTRLVDRLEQNPDDSEGWVMLGRSYTALQQFDKAQQAYTRAYQLIGDDPDFLADYAEILAMNAGNQLQGRPMDLLNTALKKDRNHIKSLWLAGHAEVQVGNNKQAVAYWKRLLNALPPEDEAVATVKQYIAQVSGEPQPQATPAGTATLTVNVQLAKSMAARARPDDTVFIFARAASGPRMPLAIVRKQVKDLPVTVTLDDSQAMTPQMTLSTFDQVVVGARVSRSGNALAQSGDIQGLSGAVASSRKQPVTITIDSVIP